MIFATFRDKNGISDGGLGRGRVCGDEGLGEAVISPLVLAKNRVVCAVEPSCPHLESGKSTSQALRPSLPGSADYGICGCKARPQDT